MTLRNTTQSYGSVAKFFHWTVALLIIFMLLLGMFMGDFAKPFKYQLYTLHKSIGLTLLFLMLLRLLWKLVNPSPKLPSTVASWQKGIAHLSHFLLYLGIFSIITAGWIMSTASGKVPNFWWLFSFSMPFIPLSKPLAHTAAEIHEILAWVISGLLVLHILGALKHHIIDKDNVLKRMMPGNKNL